MEYVAVGLAIGLVVAVIVAAASAAALKSTQNEVKDLKKKLADAENDKAALGTSANIEVSKRESVINSLKAEMADMEKQLGENKDPAVVRARLSQLVSKTP